MATITEKQMDLSWGVSPGDEILISLDGGELRLFTRKGGLRLAQNVQIRALR